MIGETEESAKKKGHRLRGRPRPLRRQRARADRRRRERHGEAGVRRARQEAPRRPHHRRARHRAGAHRRRRSCTSAGASTTSSSRSSTSPRSARCSSTPPTTASGGCGSAKKLLQAKCKNFSFGRWRSPKAKVDGRTARAERTRAAVVDALLDLIDEGAAAADAAAGGPRAGVSPRIVYFHFEDHAKLFAAAAARQTERMLADIQPISDDGHARRRGSTLRGRARAHLPARVQHPPRRAPARARRADRGQFARLRARRSSARRPSASSRASSPRCARAAYAIASPRSAPSPASTPGSRCAPTQALARGRAPRVARPHRRRLAEGVTMRRLAFALLVVAGCHSSSPTGSSSSELTYWKDGEADRRRQVRRLPHRRTTSRPSRSRASPTSRAQTDKVRVAVANHVMPPWPPGAGCSRLHRRSLAHRRRDRDHHRLDRSGRRRGRAERLPAGRAGLGRAVARRSARCRSPRPTRRRCRPTSTAASSWTGRTDRQVHHRLPRQRGQRAHRAPRDRLSRRSRADVAAYQQLDDADPAPGYVCFGGPGGPNGGAERALARRLGARLARRRLPRRHRPQGPRRQQGHPAGPLQPDEQQRPARPDLGRLQARRQRAERSAHPAVGQLDVGAEPAAW